MIAGDRNNDFIDEMVSKYILLEPNIIIIKELRKTRGRQIGEVASLMKKYLVSKKYSEDKIYVELNEKDAFELGLSLCQKDDLLIAFIEEIEQIYSLIQSKI